MKIQLLSAAVFAALMFSSCSKQEIKEETKEESIKFNGKISSLKANSGSLTTTNTWAANDEIGVFMLQLNKNIISEQANNRKFVSNGTTFLPESGQEIYYPVNSEPVDFISYAPYRTGAEIPGTLSIDLSAQTNQASIDLLWAKSNNSGAGFLKTSGFDVPLTFDHKLSKIIIKPTASSGLSSTDPTWNNMSIGIHNMYRKATFDLYTGLLSTPTDINIIVPNTVAAGQTYEAIVLPSTNAVAGAFSFTFLINGNTYTYKSSANENLEAGKEYTYNLSITKTGVTLGTVTVTNWESISRSGIAN